MKHSDKIDQIAKALVLAQGNMGAVIKNEKAQVFSKRTGGNFTYTYADLAAVLDVITPALQAQGIAFIQCPGGEPGVIEIETMLMHAESGQWLSSTLPLRLPTDDPQDAGKVITYTLGSAQRKTATIGERSSITTSELVFRLNKVTDAGDDAIIRAET